MINHARTVLLNESANAVRNISDIYVPGGFNPIVIPANLVPLYSTLVPVGITLTDKVQLVDGIVGLLMAGELLPFTLSLDNRITYDNTTVISISGLLTSPAPNLLLSSTIAAVERSTELMRVSAYIFTLPGRQQNMDSLKVLWSEQNEGIIRVGALILALIYHLDAARSL